MNDSNPTPVQIGMTGTFVGVRYRVVGRVAMSMTEGFQTYYWSEFNLAGTEAAREATLVYEEEAEGGVWRLFTPFEPHTPLSFHEAAGKRVGDTVNLDGRSLPVSLVAKSRVRHIEGQAPEGVEVGDEANYFNAEAEDRMIVVSWTGDEVEFFHGLDLPPGTVAAAFQLRSDLPSRSSLGVGGGSTQRGCVVTAVAGVLLAGILLAIALRSCQPSGRQPAVMHTAPPASRLRPGDEGRLDGRPHRVLGHALVEVARVGTVHGQHEYWLLDNLGRPALLVNGGQPGMKDWQLFTPTAPATPVPATQLAAVRLGRTMEAGGTAMPVNELFQATIRQVDGTNVANVQTGQVFYGFGARAGERMLFARWNAAGSVWYVGKTVPEADVLAAFRPAP